MTLYFSFMLTGIILVALIWLRNELVYRIRTRARWVISAENIRLIAQWMVDHPTEEDVSPLKKSMLLYPHQRAETYHEMLFDLTRWKFSQFYPDLVAVEKVLADNYSGNAA